jgi:AraC family transcriptional activator of pyochelin receptor
VEFTEYDINCIQKAKSIIDSDLRSHYSIDLIAMKVNLGKTKLKIGFKLYYTIGLYAYLKKQRMIKAGELIVNTNNTIKQISSDTGFKHPTNFIKAFVSFYGLTPRRYRQSFSAEESAHVLHQKKSL